MKDKRKVSAMNSNIVKLADDVGKAIVAEAEEILEDAENVVKEFVPARFVRKTLAAIESRLDKEGIEVEFDKTVTRDSLMKTASDEATDEELKELIDEIVNAIVEELEEVLKDADDVMDEEKDVLKADNGEEDIFEIESKIKSVVERKLHAKGIYVAFQRTAKPVEKKMTIAERIRASRKK